MTVNVPNNHGVTVNNRSIFLADLHYHGGGCHPLQCGYLSAYVQKIYPDSFDISIFIDPDKLQKKILETPPAVVGLANYAWNRNLNIQLINFVKEISPQTVTFMGGPCFASKEPDWLAQFFNRTPGMDFFINGEGEFRFAEMVGLLRDHDWCPEAVHSEVPKDVFFKDDAAVKEGQIHGELSGTRRIELDEIPSPYLSGILDEFFEYEGLSPIIESVRGCPYLCTFCCWGNILRNKLSMFSLERIKAEMDYVAARAENCDFLSFTDANFGLIERDLEIAEHLREIRVKTGWPKDLFLNFAKNSGERVVKIATVLKDMTKITFARQSMTDDVLKIIKRKNLDEASYSQLAADAGRSNTKSMVELLYPLPGETRKSFIDGLDRLFRISDPHDTEIRLYQVGLLPGAELASSETRRAYGIKSGWRPFPRSQRDFIGFSAGEFHEMIVETDDFDLSDLAFVRRLHFYITIFFTYQLYFDVTNLFSAMEIKELGVMDFINRLDAMVSSSGKLKELFDEFDTMTGGEFHFGDEPPASGTGVIGQRHNIFFAIKLLYGSGGQYRTEFDTVIRSVIVGDFEVSGKAFDAALARVQENIIDFINLADRIDRGELTALGADKCLDHLGVRAFVKNYSGDTVQNLHDIYDYVGRGYLDGVILWKSSLVRDAPAPDELDDGALRDFSSSADSAHTALV